MGVRASCRKFGPRSTRGRGVCANVSRRRWPGEGRVRRRVAQPALGSFTRQTVRMTGAENGNPSTIHGSLLPGSIPLSGRDRLVTAAAFAAGTVILIARLRERTLPPGIFAEDGPIFYLEADEMGAGAIFRPYAGYLHLVPRLGAAAVAPFGLAAVPVGYALYTVAVTLATFALVLSPRLDRVIPSVWGRALAFVAVCLVPQFWETSAVLASLIFVGGVALLLIGLSTTPATRPGRTAETAALLALGLSGPLVTFYAPLFAYRWLRDRNGHNLRLVIAAAMTAAVQLLIFLHAGRPSATFTLDNAPAAYGQRVVGELLASPVAARQAFWSQGALTRIVLVWLLAVLLVAAAELGLGALIAVAVTMFAFGWAVRTYDVLLLDPANGDRHMLVPAVTLLVITVAGFTTAVHRVRGQAGTGTKHRGGSVGTDGAVSFRRTRLTYREVRSRHAVAAVVGVVALLMTLPGIWAGATIPAWNYRPNQDQLSTFQNCVNQGREDCPPVKIPPGGFDIQAVPLSVRVQSRVVWASRKVRIVGAAAPVWASRSVENPVSVAYADSTQWARSTSKWSGSICVAATTAPNAGDEPHKHASP